MSDDIKYDSDTTDAAPKSAMDKEAERLNLELPKPQGRREEEKTLKEHRESAYLDHPPGSVELDHLGRRARLLHDIFNFDKTNDTLEAAFNNLEVPDIHVTDDLTVDGEIIVEVIRAVNGDGLQLQDDGGNLGVFIKDGGNIGIRESAPSMSLHVTQDGTGLASEPTWDADKDIALFEAKAATNGAIQILTDNTLVGVLAFSDTDSRNRGWISYNHNLERLNLGSAGATTVVIRDSEMGLFTTDLEDWADSNWYGIEIGYATALMFRPNTEPDLYILCNAYYDGTWKYKTTNEVLRIRMDNSASMVDLAYAASGTADAAITWAGNVQFRLASDELHVGGKANGSNRDWTIYFTSDNHYFGWDESASGVRTNGHSYCSLYFRFAGANTVGNRDIGYASSGGFYVIERYSSSEKFKENIRDYEITLEEIASFRPIAYDHIGTPEVGPVPDVGMSAEQVHSVRPDFVKMDAIDPSVDLTKVPFNVKHDKLGAIGAVMIAREVIALKERVAELEAVNGNRY